MKAHRSLLIKPVLLLLWAWFALLLISSATAAAPLVVELEVDDVISPATADFINRGLRQAQKQNAELAIIKLDTPGGLDSSMRKIIRDILASSVPVATFVSPGGARAASAGTFILYASHIAAMTPASNLGAASPVAVGPGGASDPDAGTRPAASPEGDTDSQPDDNKESGDAGAESGADRPVSSGDDVMAGKVKSDAAAYIRSLAQLRGRNIDFAEQAVLTAKSLSAQDALEQNVIEFIARDVPHLLQQLDGHDVVMSEDRTIQLQTADAIIHYEEPGWRTRLLSILTNPQLALVLMMVGIYGLFFELTSPGFAVPGVAGLICLLLGLYAFHLLPVNWAGVALVVAGSILMIAEVFFPSFGALGVGGIIAFVLGGLFLTDTGIPGYDVSLPFIVGMAVASALLLTLAGTMVARSRKQTVTTGANAMVGLVGVVTHQADGVVYAQVRGEQWRVVSSKALTPGDRIRVTAVEGLTLHVEPTKSR